MPFAFPPYGPHHSTKMTAFPAQAGIHRGAERRPIGSGSAIARRWNQLAGWTMNPGFRRECGIRGGASRSPPEIDFDDARVVLHVLDRALGQDRALVQHRDP